jgi:hypothetical protein
MLSRLDKLVMSGAYPSRSEAIRLAVMDLLRRLGGARMVIGGNANVDDVFARVVCENGHVIAYLRAGNPGLTERIRALQTAGLVCPICRTQKLYIEIQQSINKH